MFSTAVRLLTILFIASVVLKATSSLTEPSFTGRQPFECLERIEIDPGGTIKLHCEVAGNPKPNISWTKSGQKVGNHADFSMELRNVSQRDEGLYQCEACNVVGCIHFQYLLTLGSVDSRSFVVDSRVKISCDLEGTYRKWAKLEFFQHCYATVMDKENRKVADSDENNLLVFDQVSYAHAGLYLCTNGTNNHFMELRVLNNRNESKSSERNRLVRKNAGETVVLGCAWRNSNVTWTKNGTQINSNASVIALIDLDRQKGGLYKCEVCHYSNCVDYHFILVIDTVFNPQSMRNKSAEVDDIFILDCRTILLDYNIPINVDYIASYVVDEQNPTIPDNVTKLDINNVFAIIIFHREMWYTCIVESPYGIYYRSAYVRQPKRGDPRFASKWQMKKYFRETDGTSVRISCDATGDPPPNITWTKDDTFVRNTTGISFNNNNYSITLENVTKTDSGEYTCKICNIRGCNERMYWMLVGDIFDRNEQSITVEENSEVNFICTDQYYSFIRKIEWTKINGKNSGPLLNTLHYVKPYHILNIQNANRSDAGNYSCKVFLHRGDEMEKIFLLKILHNGTTDNREPPLPEPLSPTMIAVSVFASLCFCVLLTLLILMYRKNKEDRDVKWIKKITIAKQSPDNNIDTTDGIQMPTIQIEPKRSKAVRRGNPEVDYEFPIDWSWEIPRDQLILGAVLGEGAFGKVVLAEAHGLSDGSSSSTPVAVKMLKKGHLEVDVTDFVCEMEIMKMIGKHPNIINLVGCCCADGPLYVIVEYAPHGNLKNFLREHHPEERNDLNLLSQQQLITFALQIAQGMEYLASRRCVHRDLAARNILVSDGYVMKISDFGLARDVLDYEYYRKVTPGKLPIRWMAPESLEHRFYNAQSDVWSFGVLTWEIMTFGGYPYADWDGFLEQLKHGKRLEQPETCPDQVYQLMRSCWQLKPEGRPTFVTIVQSLERIADQAYGDRDLGLESSTLEHETKM